MSSPVLPFPAPALWIQTRLALPLIDSADVFWRIIVSSAGREFSCLPLGCSWASITNFPFCAERGFPCPCPALMAPERGLPGPPHQQQHHKKQHLLLNAPGPHPDASGPHTLFAHPSNTCWHKTQWRTACPQPVPPCPCVTWMAGTYRCLGQPVVTVPDTGSLNGRATSAGTRETKPGSLPMYYHPELAARLPPSPPSPCPGHPRELLSQNNPFAMTTDDLGLRTSLE